LVHRAIDLLVVAIGSKPNTELFADQLELTSAGNIAIKGKNSSTSIPGVFAAGDVTDVAYGRVVIAAGQGAMAALDAARYLDLGDSVP
jgi:thioredoxin reductase (NADPH)